MRSTFPCRLPLLSLVLVFWITIPGLAAWTGQVVDAHTGQPVPGAVLVDEDHSLRIVADEAGSFVLPTGLDLRRGGFTVHRIGYFSRGWQPDPRELSPTTLAPIALEPKPITLEEIVLTGERSIGDGVDVFSGDRLQEGLPSDVAAVFANTPGYGLVRKGSYGADPVIRGFKRDQLLVRVDGIGTVSCACPNRMDPITAHVQPDELRDIEVFKGPHSLRYGSSIGGVINLSLNRPVPGPGHPDWTVSASARYEENGDGQAYRASLGRSDRSYGFHLSGGIKQFGDVVDGDGRTIPAGYDVIDYTATGALRLGASHTVDAMLRQSFGTDIAYAGLPMDTRKNDATLAQLRWRWDDPASWLTRLEVSAYAGGADHEMDNADRPNRMMVEAVTPVTSENSGGRIDLLAFGGRRGILFLGMDRDRVAKAGERTRTMVATGMVMTDPVWQDAWSQNVGAYAEWQGHLDASTRYALGLRGDWHETGADDPAPSLEAEFGDDLSQQDAALSATASVGRSLGESGRATLALGHGTRFPSLTERYIHHLTVGQDMYEYRGTPTLKPEQNTQLDLSVGWLAGPVDMQVSGYVSFLRDAISAEVDPTLARVYMPTSPPTVAKRFVNLDEARVSGVELVSTVQPRSDLWLTTGVAYTHAEDLERDEPMPEIAPLEARWTVRYTPSFARTGWLELQGRHVAEQTRVSEAFGESETAGFSVYHLRVGVTLLNHLTATAGVRNLLDATYHEHLNRARRNQWTMGPLYEPGRNVFIQLGVSY